MLLSATALLLCAGAAGSALAETPPTASVPVIIVVEDPDIAAEPKPVPQDPAAQTDSRKLGSPVEICKKYPGYLGCPKPGSEENLLFNSTGK